MGSRRGVQRIVAFKLPYLGIAEELRLRSVRVRHTIVLCLIMLLITRREEQERRQGVEVSCAPFLPFPDQGRLDSDHAPRP